MTTIVFIWEVALLCSLLVLGFVLQDWSKFKIFRSYIEKRQNKKDEKAIEKLLNDLPQGVVRYKEKEVSYKK